MLYENCENLYFCFCLIQFNPYNVDEGALGGYCVVYIGHYKLKFSSILVSWTTDGPIILFFTSKEKICSPLIHRDGNLLFALLL